MKAARSVGGKGAPLALFALLLGGWVAGRVMLWEPPMTAAALPLAETGAAPTAPAAAQAVVMAQLDERTSPLAVAPSVPLPSALRGGQEQLLRGPQPAPRVDGAAGREAEAISDLRGSAPPRAAPVSPITPPALVPAAGTARPKRWSVDAWGFWRQGSDAAPIAQSRVPIYGASQIGVVAQYRLAPGMGMDPRAYTRAYRAMVPRGESELALGASLRPLPRVPLRAFAEMRYTDAAFATEWRPALFVVSELPPQALPAGFSLEAYGQAGWVGGDFATGFADGQVVAMREVARLAPFGASPVRLSAGAGAWGGIQRDASRVDVGPSVRLEWTMGRVPARLSLDWREQVSGDAAPQSGVAATLATGF